MATDISTAWAPMEKQDAHIQRSAQLGKVRELAFRKRNKKEREQANGGKHAKENAQRGPR